jgi:RNA-directed DNA polymerase
MPALTKRVVALKKFTTYEAKRSPLFGLENKRRLAELLSIDPSLLALGKSGVTSQYRRFTDGDSGRFITEPIQKLLQIHRRLLNLLKRIEIPEYLHSARKGRSYKSNAASHIGGHNVLKIDVKKFYPSVTFSYVHDFFRTTLQCAPDVATILAKLCTVETGRGVHLATGSCLSPLLSFMVNRKMFDRLETLCLSNGCTFTLYVDDITVSGANATGSLLTMLACEIKRHGYDYHKIQRFEGNAALVTGAIVGKERLALPRVRAKKIRALREQLPSLAGAEKSQVLARLIGSLCEAEQIDTRYKAQRHATLSEYRTEWQAIVAARANSARTTAAKRAASRKPLATSSTLSAPF